MQFAINFAGMYTRTGHSLTHTLQEITTALSAQPALYMTDLPSLKFNLPAS